MINGIILSVIPGNFFLLDFIGRLYLKTEVYSSRSYQVVENKQRSWTKASLFLAFINLPPISLPLSISRSNYLFLFFVLSLSLTLSLCGSFFFALSFYFSFSLSLSLSLPLFQSLSFYPSLSIPLFFPSLSVSLFLCRTSPEASDLIIFLLQKTQFQNLETSVCQQH